MTTWEQARPAAQIAHIKEHQAAFTDLTGYDDVDDYFAVYYPEKPDIYIRLCDDLGLTPRAGAGGLRRAE